MLGRPNRNDNQPNHSFNQRHSPGDATVQPRNLSVTSVWKARWCNLHVCSYDRCLQLPSQIAHKRSFERRCHETFPYAQKVPCHLACEIIEQLKFNTDLIEVSNGFCFSILQCRFIISPIAPSMRGKISPRAYIPYDCFRLHHSPATSEIPYSIRLKTLSPQSISSTSFTSVCSHRRCRTK